MSDDNKTSDVEVVPDEETIDPIIQGKLKKIKDELGQCDEEKKHYLDGWQRAKADFLNYKKDEAKRLEDLARFVTSGLIADFLPVLDSFDLGLKSIGAGGGTNTLQEQGILLIRSQMLDALKKRGVEIIPVKPGDDFNTEKHESLGEIESEFLPGTIAEEVQKGYVFRDKVLRPARVRLSKNK